MFILRGLVVVIAVTALANVTHAFDFTTFKSSCLATCIQSESDKPTCNSHCDCTVDELRKLKGKELQSVSEAKVKEIGEMCGGIAAASYFVGGSCADECKDDSCKTACACMKDKIGGLGGSKEVGAFFVRAGKEDPAAVAKLNEWMAVCKKGG